MWDSVFCSVFVFFKQKTAYDLRISDWISDVCSSDLNFGLGTSDFAAITTLAPSRAARSAIARPMPREAPVMNAVFPCREDIALRLELEVPTMITAIATPSAALQRPIAPAQPYRQRQPRSGQRPPGKHDAGESEAPPPPPPR